MSAFEFAPPHFSEQDVTEMLNAKYGMSGTLRALESERDQNFEVKTDQGKYVFKIANAGEDISFLELQNDSLTFLKDAGFNGCPEMVLTKADEQMFVAQKDGRDYHIRLLTFLDGDLYSQKPVSLDRLADLGRFMGKFSKAFSGFYRPAAHRPEFIWNLDNALAAEEYFPSIANPAHRERAEQLFAHYRAETAPKLQHLRMAVIHQDANDNNLVIDPANESKVTGLIDFGDMCHGRQINELAVTMAYALMDQDDLFAASKALVCNYCAEFPLFAEELDVLFDLIRMRLTVSVAMSSHQIKAHPDNEYLLVSQKPALELLDRLDDVDPQFMTALFRHAAGLDAVDHASHIINFLEENQPNTVSLFKPDFKYEARFIIPADGSDTTIPPFSDKAFNTWFDDKCAKEEARFGIGRYGEDRTVYQTDAFASKLSKERRTIHMGVDVFVHADEPLHAPMAGEVYAVHDNAFELDYGPTLILKHETDKGVPFYSLYGHLSRSIFDLHHVGDKIEKGQLIGHIGDWDVNGGWYPHLHFQIMTSMLSQSTNFNGVAHKSMWDVWQQICPNPNLLMNQAPQTFEIDEQTPEKLMQRRANLLGPSLSVSYKKKLKMVSGKGVHLYDHTGRAFVDCVNNITHIGHCHPHLVEAISRQAAILNTNTRYLSELVLDFAERITSKMPAHLSVAYFVNSGTEANELALRIARQATGQKDTIVLDWAYHGNSQGAVDVSPYKFKRKGGFPQPDFTHIAEFPDPFRGPYRYGDNDAGAKYADDVKRRIAEIKAKTGNGAAVFIAESISGVGGQVAYPEGYFKAVYEAIRAEGGVCIADEVQCGFGRVGEHFWAYELQDVVPDIVVMGKPIGNGHPLAAVVTTKELADKFNTGMEYFNSFGGNPVSMAVGMAVMDVIENEGLQAHAKELGNYILGRWHEIKDKYDLVGDVRGHGLFLGMELIEDEQLTPATEKAGAIVNALRDRSILFSTDGPLDNVLKFKPPMVFSRENADFMCDQLDEVISAFS
jgi:4-aminobutyrate aminotransferase-like enzyme/Ser/Thr protein kinase RdoA (MazF antagonist)